MADLKSVVTRYRRIQLAQITSGAIREIPKISHIAFGENGVDGEGNPLTPSESQTSLNGEFCRYAVGDVTFPIETTARYTVTIPREEQVGQKFNEMALVDEEGNLCAIKNMYTKQKDDDVIFTFEFDDEF